MILRQRASFWIALLVVAIPLGGCRNLLKKREPTETASASPPAPPPPVPEVAPTPSVTEVAPLDAPTPEDFEDEAFETISAKNLEAELARLRKEIEQAP